MSTLTDYKKQKEDILYKSNNLLIALNNKRQSETSKIKNRTNGGNGGSNEDLRYFMENSLKMEADEILKNKNDELQQLKEKSLNTARANSIAKRKQDLANIKSMASIFSKIF
ncbi:MAG: hypothetical protein LBH40_04210 [Alphaproteobacteria bacterium]|jgi:hypothetical protein|nr:hypothetical protein [Alphaproteobacteria bacterium]